MKRTAAVIVTYNRKAMLQRCLRALCTQTAGVPELWVIDNASTDGTAELVAQLNLPTMHYYNTGKNLGGAGGFACGIQQAACSGAEYLWIMDDDCLPEPDALQQLLLAVGLCNSIMFPTIFALSLRGLGNYTKRASSYLMMSPIGGAVGPLMMGYVADQTNMSFSFIVPLLSFIVVLLYAWKVKQRSFC